MTKNQGVRNLENAADRSYRNLIKITKL